MNRQELLNALSHTLSDRRISRSERRALHAIVGESDFSEHELRALRHDALVLAGEQLHDPRDREVLGWLDEVLSLLDPAPESREVPRPRVLFGPEDPMVETLVSLIDGARQTLDVAVFTITDDRVRDALLRAHQRGVALRILSDADKAHDSGSDIYALRRAGVALRQDGSHGHFHHKFAVFDGKLAITGSYNWTRGADRDNRENFLVTWDAEVVRAYSQGFARMWEELG